MSKTKAKKIVKEYGKALKKARFPFRALYLFGSHSKGHAHTWSDIDVAVVSDKLKTNYDKNRWFLWQIRMDVDNRIEPHGFTVEDFSFRRLQKLDRKEIDARLQELLGTMRV